MLFISKKQLIPTNVNVAMYYRRLFQSSLQIGQFKLSFPDLVHGKAIAVFITRVQYLAQTLIRKIRRGKPL